MGKENQSSTPTYEYCFNNKQDLVFNTAKDLLYLSDEFTKENIDEAFELATYLYERVYEDKKSVKDESEVERDKMTIKYLEETLDTVKSMLDKLCQKYKK